MWSLWRSLFVLVCLCDCLYDACFSFAYLPPTPSTPSLYRHDMPLDSITLDELADVWLPLTSADVAGEEALCEVHVILSKSEDTTKVSSLLLSLSSPLPSLP